MNERRAAALAAVQSIEVAMTAVESIEGWLTTNEAGCLYDLAATAKGPIVEIGSWQGRSTAALAMGAIDGTGQHVTAIDSFRGVPPINRATSHGSLPGWNSSSPEILRANLDAVGINGQVTIIPLSSEEAAAQIGEIDLLFIDGDHSYQAVCSDLELYLPKIRNKGKVVLHDCITADMGVVLAVDKLLMSKPNEWRPLGRVDSAVIFERRPTIRYDVLLGFPGNELIYGAAEGLRQATLGAHNLTHEQSSIGWDDMNRLWVWVLNNARAKRITHFAMLHSDIVPSPGWVDLLIDELDEHKADFISTIVPLKSEEGITSCGIGDSRNQWLPIRRFTMREVMRMPATFAIEDTDYPNDYLLHNSGCLVADLRNPLWRTTDAGGNLLATFAFPIGAKLQANGDFAHHRESEDWHFSRQMAGLGLKTLSTRKVAAIHVGSKGFSNDHAWGTKENDDAAIELRKQGFQSVLT